MESVEYLIRQGYKPKRDIYIALGHDEERMGKFGARNVSGLLKQRGVRFDFVIDEGGAIINGSEAGIHGMAAMIGVCEKGYADIKLTAESAGGHASRPPKRTAVGTLSEAIVRLEKYGMKNSFNKPLRSMLEVVAGYMNFPLNVIASNLFITKPLIMKAYSSNPARRAMIHTTIAPTMLKGSTATNVLAESAEGIINCRISPDDSVDKLVRHVKKIAGSGIKVEILDSHEPSLMSSTDSEAYRIIAQTAAETFKGYVIAPILMVAATDSRWYREISDGVYLFEPFRSLIEDTNTMHAAGERIKIDSLLEGTEFFIRLVKRAG
jgi:carboxypeptidase PM20D1